MSGLRRPPIKGGLGKDQEKAPSKEEQKKIDEAKKAEAKKKEDSLRGFDDSGRITSSSSKRPRRGSGTRKPVVDATAGRQGSIHHGKHSVETAGGKLKSLHSMTLGELFNINKG